MAMAVTLFYSWQSDRDGALCRRFIETALEQAVELLRAEGIDLTIDADTRNVPGTPPITATILGKIDACDIFLGDVTFVGRSEGGAEKLVPNPNVMGEYGYALKAKGSERIILAMNKAFGPPESLPFDMKHTRHPEQYDAPEGIADGARRRERSAFAQKLTKAIAPIARLGPHRLSGPDSRALAGELAINRLMEFPLGGAPAIVSRPRLVLEYAPFAVAAAPDFRAAEVAAVVERFLPPGYQRSEQGADERTWWTHAPKRAVPDKPNPETDWAFAVTREGVLEFSVTLGRLIDDDPAIVLNGRQIEAWIVRMSERLAETAQALTLGGPAVVVAGLDGVENVEIVAGRLPARRIDRTSIPLRARTIMPAAEQPMGDQLRNLLDDFWLAVGYPAGSPSFGSGRWDGDAAAGEFEIP